MTPSAEAYNIIAEAATKLGKVVPRINTGYGSGWMCEFPVVVSQILDTRGRGTALAHAFDMFNAGDCSSAMQSVNNHG